jgi:hypothetical protein
MAEGNPEINLPSHEEGSPAASRATGYIQYVIDTYPEGRNENHYRRSVLTSGAVPALFEAAYNFFVRIYPDSDPVARQRFAEITVVEGPDRALEAYGNYDDLWDALDVPREYIPPRVLFGAEGEVNDALDQMRDHYYQFISRRKDPRKETDPKVEPVHYQPTFQFVEPGREPPSDQRINVRYPLPPLHPVFTEEQTPDLRRKAVHDRRSSGFFEFRTPGTTGLNMPSAILEEGEGVAMDDEDTIEPAPVEQGEHHFQPIQPGPFEGDDIDSAFGFNTGPLNQPPAADSDRPPQPQPPASTDVPRVPQPTGARPKGSTPAVDAAAQAQAQAALAQAQASARKQQEDAEMALFYQRQREQDLLQQQQQQLLSQQRQQQRIQQNQQPSSASPLLHPRSPPVPNVTRIRPTVPQPTGLRPDLTQQAPLSFPAPALRPPTHLMALARPTFIGYNTPVRSQTSRPVSAQQASRPTSAATPPAPQPAPAASSLPFFKRAPTQPLHEDTFDEEIRRPDQDFADYQRGPYQWAQEEQKKQSDLVGQLTTIIKEQVGLALGAYGIAPPPPGRSSTTFQQPSTYYCDSTGCYDEYGQPVPQTRNPRQSGYKMPSSEAQKQSDRVHFSDSVYMRDYEKNQRKTAGDFLNQESDLLRRERTSEGFQIYGQPEVVKPTPILPGVGLVMDRSNYAPQRVLVKKKPESDPVLDALQATNMSEEAKMTTYALVLAQREALKKDKKDEYEIQTVTAAKQQNTNPDSFDYNIRGQTPSDILGPRFGKTYFSSELERQIAMKGIFQRVVDDPSCHETTRLVALRVLGQFDGPRQLREEMALSTIQTMDAFKTTLSGGSFSDSTKIEPPILGNRHEINAGVLKELYYALGMSQGVKYKPGQGRPLRFYLHILGARITSMRLNAESAYFLLLSLFEGDLHSDLQGMMLDKVPFERTWDYIQNLGTGPVSKDNLEKDLQAAFKDPKLSLLEVLSRIQVIYSNLHDHVKNKEDRDVLIRTSTVEQFKNFITLQYGPSSLTTIEALVENERATWKASADIRRSHGLPDLGKFDEVRSLKQNICLILGHSARTPKSSANVSLHTLDAQISSLSLDPQPSTITSIPASQMAVLTSQPSTHQPAQPIQQVGFNQGFMPQSFNSGRSRGRGRSNGYGRRQQDFQNNQWNPQQQLQQEYPNPNHMPLGQPQRQQQPNPGVISGFKPIDFEKLDKPIPRGVGPAEPMRIPGVCYELMERGYCFNCAVPGHFVYECPLYPGQTPIERRCDCAGFHASECRSKYRDQMYDVKTRGGWTAPPAPAPRPNDAMTSNNQGGYGNNGGYQGQRGGGYQGYQGNQNGGGYRGYQNGGYNRGSRGGRGNNRGYGRGFGYGGGFRQQQQQAQGNWGYPNQGPAYPAADHQDPGNNTSNRAGNVLGNEGAQATPATAFMNTNQVSYANN